MARTQLVAKQIIWRTPPPSYATPPIMLPMTRRSMARIKRIRRARACVNCRKHGGFLHWLGPTSNDSQGCRPRSVPLFTRIQQHCLRDAHYNSSSNGNDDYSRECAFVVMAEMIFNERIPLSLRGSWVLYQFSRSQSRRNYVAWKKM